MIRLKDWFESIIYRVCRSDAANGFSACTACHKRRKHWLDLTFKKDLLIAYDRILDEWVVFSEYNGYSKIWVMNKYIVKIYTLHEQLWKQLKPLCGKCVHGVMKDYVEQEEEDENR